MQGCSWKNSDDKSMKKENDRKEAGSIIAYFLKSDNALQKLFTKIT